MKPKSSRFLGMTVTQVSILAGLAALTGLSICGMFFLIYQGRVRQTFPQPNHQRKLKFCRNSDSHRGTISDARTVATATIPVPILPPADGFHSPVKGGNLAADSYVGGDMLRKTVGNHQGNPRPGSKPIKLQGLAGMPAETILEMLDKDSATSRVITAVVVFRFKTDEKSAWMILLNKSWIRQIHPQPSSVRES